MRHKRCCFTTSTGRLQAHELWGPCSALPAAQALLVCLLLRHEAPSSGYELGQVTGSQHREPSRQSPCRALATVTIQSPRDSHHREPSRQFTMQSPRDEASNSCRSSTCSSCLGACVALCTFLTRLMKPGRGCQACLTDSAGCVCPCKLCWIEPGQVELTMCSRSSHCGTGMRWAAEHHCLRCLEVAISHYSSVQSCWQKRVHMQAGRWRLGVVPVGWSWSAICGPRF